MPERSGTLAKHMTLMDRPFRYNDTVFWCAYDAYVYIFETYHLYVRMGEITEEGITAAAMHDALVARCSYLPSMREDVRNDPHIVWGESDLPDLSDQPESRAKSALSQHWTKYIATAAMACVQVATRRYDRGVRAR